MKDLWINIRNEVKRIMLLDSLKDTVWGAHVHRYIIAPCVSVDEIQAYEERHNTQLPENYRSYLQYYGAGGAGPDLGVFKFSAELTQGNLSKPLVFDNYRNFDFSEGYAETENVNGPLYELDSMIRIGNAGQSQNYLVVSGKLRGNVICWDRMGGLGFVSGTFDCWYQQWLKCLIYGLRENEVLKTVKIGMHLTEIQRHPDLNVLTQSNRSSVLYFKYAKWWIKLDDNDQVIEISFDSYPVGHSGFRVWSEKNAEYTG